MNLLTQLPSRLPTDPKEKVKHIRIIVAAIKQDIRNGEASETDILCALNNIQILAGD